MTTSKMPSEPVSSKTRILTWSLFWVYSVFIYQGAVLPPSRIPSFFLYLNDKFIHGFFYFLLFAAACLAFKNAQWVYLRVLPEKSALVYCALMGIVTEVSQIFVPGRSCDAADWTADVVGAALGLFLYRFLNRSGKRE